MENPIKNIIKLGHPWKTQDPFLFCVHHYDEYPAGNEDMGPDPVSLRDRRIGQDFHPSLPWRMYHGSKIPGFPYHPHRGFETVTIAKKGVIDHSDSLGAAGRFSTGDVQWMTAGKGVQHSEMFPLINRDKDNHLELFQIWLNLPKRSKMVEPHFKMLWKEDIPVVVHEDENGKKTQIDLIAGKVADQRALDPTPDSWAADEGNQVEIYTVQMEAGAKFRLSAADKDSTRTVFFYSGNRVLINGQELDKGFGAEVIPDTELEIQAGEQDAYLLILGGKPMNEPVVQYGPFVMNSEAEIQQAYEEYRSTEFGGWPWPEREQTHGRDKGRFALHSDGREEFPNS